MELYMLGQSARILKHLFVQDLRKAAWEMFHLCISSTSELWEQVLDKTVLNILTGDMAEVESIRVQLDICEERLKAQLFKDRDELEVTLEQVLSRLKSVLEKGRNSDLLSFREMLAKLSLRCLECLKESSWRQLLQPLLRLVSNTLRFVVANSDQLEIGLSQKQFMEFVQQIMQMGSE